MNSAAGRILLIGLVVCTALAFGPSAVAATEDPVDGAGGGAGLKTLFLLDVSGSMGWLVPNTGETRLQQAIGALNEALPSNPGNDTAMLTFSGGCWFAGPNFQFFQGREIANSLDSLHPADGTPTGPALKAALDRMGDSDGQIVLISDGESTCGESACEIAANSNREIVVNTVSFHLGSDEGRAELECIAEATGGAHVDLADFGRLKQFILSLTAVDSGVAIRSTSLDSPDTLVFEVGFDHPENVTRDLIAVEARMVVSNGFSNPVDVRDSILRRSLGTIRASEDPDAAAAASAVFRWRLPDSCLDPLAQVTFEFFATNLQTRISTTYTVRSLTEDVLSGRAAERLRESECSRIFEPAEGEIIQVAAILGDSYSSGEGSGYYQWGSDLPDVNTCHRGLSYGVHPSDNPGPWYLPALQRPENPRPNTLIACSGAVIYDLFAQSTKHSYTPIGEVAESLLGRDLPPMPSQVQMLRDYLLAQGRRPDRVTIYMTIGGNDLGFGDIAFGCFLPACSDSGLAGPLDLDVTSREILAGRLQGFSEDLAHTYQMVHAGVVDLADEVELVVLPYPDPFQDSSGNPRKDCVPGFDDREVALLHDFVLGIERAVHEGVARAQQAGVPVAEAASVVNAFRGAGLCETSGGYMSASLTWEVAGHRFPRFGKSQFAHPNFGGYREMWKAVVADWPSIRSQLTALHAGSPSDSSFAAQRGLSCIEGSSEVDAELVVDVVRTSSLRKTLAEWANGAEVRPVLRSVRISPEATGDAFSNEWLDLFARIVRESMPDQPAEWRAALEASLVGFDPDADGRTGLAGRISNFPSVDYSENTLKDFEFSVAAPGSLAAGGCYAVTFKSDDPGPETWLSLSLHSTPRNLITTTFGHVAEYTAFVWVPPDVAEGGHTLVVTGVDALGRSHQVETPVSVTVDGSSHLGVWVGLGLAFSLVGGVGAVVLFRRRRSLGEMSETSSLS